MSSRKVSSCAVCGAPQTRRRPMFRIDHDPTSGPTSTVRARKRGKRSCAACSGLARLPRSRPSATGRDEHLSEGVIPIGTARRGRILTPGWVEWRPPDVRDDEREADRR